MGGAQLSLDGEGFAREPSSNTIRFKDEKDGVSHYYHANALSGKYAALISCPLPPIGPRFILDTDGRVRRLTT